MGVGGAIWEVVMASYFYSEGPYNQGKTDLIYWPGADHMLGCFAKSQALTETGLTKRP